MRSTWLGNLLLDLDQFPNLALSWTDPKSPQNNTKKRHALQTFKYPRASLLGLPPELRLQIYTYLAKSIHLHLDYVRDPTWTYPWHQDDWVIAHCIDSPTDSITRFCTAPDPTFCQLCTKPFLSGLHPTEETCHTSKSNKSDPFALRATCKTIYQETRGVLDRKELGFSVHAGDARGVLRALRPDARTGLVRLTLVHAPSIVDCAIHQAVAYFHKHALSFRSLRTIAVQTTQPRYKFCVKRPRNAPLFDPERTWQKLWFVRALDEAFYGDVTVVLEAWVVARAGYRQNQGEGNEMVVVRGWKWGAKERKRKGSVEFEMRRREIVATELNAPWKAWWKGDQMGYGRRPC
ncbi:Nn.00g005420.m01.CDS01 [Neocucurbitaria sp. VM-36]